MNPSWFSNYFYFLIEYGEHILDVPHDMLHANIFPDLRIQDIGNLAMTCHHFWDAAEIYFTKNYKIASNDGEMVFDVERLYVERNDRLSANEKKLFESHYQWYEYTHEDGYNSGERFEEFSQMVKDKEHEGWKQIMYPFYDKDAENRKLYNDFWKAKEEAGPLKRLILAKIAPLDESTPSRYRRLHAEMKNALFENSLGYRGYMNGGPHTLQHELSEMPFTNKSPMLTRMVLHGNRFYPQIQLQRCYFKKSTMDLLLKRAKMISTRDYELLCLACPGMYLQALAKTVHDASTRLRRLRIAKGLEDFEAEDRLNNHEFQMALSFAKPKDLPRIIELFKKLERSEFPMSAFYLIFFKENLDAAILQFLLEKETLSPEWFRSKMLEIVNKPHYRPLCLFIRDLVIKKKGDAWSNEDILEMAVETALINEESDDFIKSLTDLKMFKTSSWLILLALVKGRSLNVFESLLSKTRNENLSFKPFKCSKHLHHRMKYFKTDNFDPEIYILILEKMPMDEWYEVTYFYYPKKYFLDALKVLISLAPEGRSLNFFEKIFQSSFFHHAYDSDECHFFILSEIYREKYCFSLSWHEKKAAEGVIENLLSTKSLKSLTKRIACWENLPPKWERKHPFLKHLLKHALKHTGAVKTIQSAWKHSHLMYQMMSVDIELRKYLVATEWIDKVSENPELWAKILYETTESSLKLDCSVSIIQMIVEQQGHELNPQLEIFVIEFAILEKKRSANEQILINLFSKIGSDRLAAADVAQLKSYLSVIKEKQANSAT